MRAHADGKVTRRLGWPKRAITLTGRRFIPCHPRPSRASRAGPKDVAPRSSRGRGSIRQFRFPISCASIDAVATSSPRAVVKRSGMLNTDEAASFQTTLAQHTPYAIIAVCDDDCSRLQLTLLSPSGSDIAKERNSESLPTLHFTAATTGVYGIRVVMEGCRWNPCWYAIAVVPLRNTPS